MSSSPAGLSARVILGLALLLGGVAGLALSQTQVPVATTIKTDKGDFQVPGRAFLDGRNLQAEPRFTTMSLSVWQSPERRQAVCTAEHGTEVALLEVQRSVDQQRYYFRVRTSRCTGWVQDTVLSTRKTEPVGQRRQ